MTPPAGRFCVALGQDTLAPTPVWTALDLEYPSLVADYSIDRGRSFELDRVDTGRATVTISDRDGLLDPTSPGGLEIDVLTQAALCLRDPITDTWELRYRGFVESLAYDFDPSQLVNRVTVELVDLFELLSVIEMFPGHFGDAPPEGADVFFEDTADGDTHGMQTRCLQVLGNAGIPEDFYVVFSGNVSIHEASYSAGESAMTVIQDAVDAEFPLVGNVYCNRHGQLAIHGRYARFDPEGHSGPGTGWDFRDFRAGDGAAVNASPSDTAHIRAFSMTRDLAKVINRALVTPKSVLSGAALQAALTGQVVEASGSVSDYGIRPWSTEGLLTKQGIRPGGAVTDDWTETKTYGQYYVDNYKRPRTRVQSVSFRPLHPSATGAAANWDLLARCDLNDRVTVTIGSPGGGGITAAQFFIEGIHEQTKPMTGELDEVTLTLDLSPADYYLDNPWTP